MYFSVIFFFFFWFKICNIIVLHTELQLIFPLFAYWIVIGLPFLHLFRSGVSKLDNGGPLSCKVYLFILRFGHCTYFEQIITSRPLKNMFYLYRLSVSCMNVIWTYYNRHFVIMRPSVSYIHSLPFINPLQWPRGIG